LSYRYIEYRTLIFVNIRDIGTHVSVTYAQQFGGTGNSISE